jgi:ribosomal-protein-alanine acetyltransferase
VIRPATPGDLDAIMLIERRSFPTDAWSAEMMAAELASPHGRYLVDAESAGESELVVGYGGVRALRGSADADIQTIALDAAHRGSGRGRALLRALLAEAAERGAREVFLEVRADNPVAERLYVSEGFVEIGRRAGYYQPDDVDAIVMRRDLRGRDATVLRTDSPDRAQSEGDGAEASIRPENGNAENGNAANGNEEGSDV